MSTFETFRSAIEKRMAYLQTRNEIRKIPLDVALDLGIHPGDAEAVAHKAVYG